MPGTDEPADDFDVVLIAAVAANGVIGAAGSIPWHYPEDLQQFKRTTTGHPVVLGRKTFENIVERLGEPLADRTSIVLSRSLSEWPHDEVHVVSDVSAALSRAAQTGAETVYVAGGETVYDAFLDRADRLRLTELVDEYEGDRRFPAWPPGSDWIERSRDEREDFAFVTYDRSPESSDRRV
jgi:dihydrofolate reductase